jgi:N-succinyldiaminopimelate aminotransferase
VTTGCTEGIAAALLGLVNPGDEVVVLEPYYDSYVAMIQMTGGVRRPVTLRAPDFRLDVDELRAAVTDRTRFVLLNSPHNPTGTVLTRDELGAVAAVAVERDLVVITDEVYEHLTFTGHEHVPLATLPGMADRTLTLSSAGKSYSFTGWKVGWATGPAELVGAVLAAKQWLTFTSGAPLQPAVATALDEHPDFPAALAAGLEEKRDLLCAGLEKVGLPGRPPDGTYFATSDITGLGWPDAMAFCLALPERAGVVGIPTQAFYDDPDAGRQLVRWAFCKRRDVIEEGVSRLAAADLAYG